VFPELLGGVLIQGHFAEVLKNNGADGKSRD
jgi:hypothetical protein